MNNDIKKDNKPKRLNSGGGSDAPTPEEKAPENNEQEVTENEETDNG